MKFEDGMNIISSLLIVSTSWLLKLMVNINQKDITFALSALVSILGIVFFIYSIKKIRKEIKKLDKIDKLDKKLNDK